MNKPSRDTLEPRPSFDESILKIEGDEVVRAIQVSPLNEFRFRDFCNENGFVNYLPLQRSWKIHNFTSKGKAYNYSKAVLRPMFPSYVFVKTKVENLRTLFDSKVLVRFLQPPNQAAFLEEIRTVRIAELVGLQDELKIHADIPEGAHFLIQSGVWEGVTGWLSHKDGLYKWTVRIEFVDQLITASIDPTQYKMMRLDK